MDIALLKNVFTEYKQPAGGGCAYISNQNEWQLFLRALYHEHVPKYCTDLFISDNKVNNINYDFLSSLIIEMFQTSKFQKVAAPLFKQITHLNITFNYSSNNPYRLLSLIANEDALFENVTTLDLKLNWNLQLMSGFLDGLKQVATKRKNIRHFTLRECNFNDVLFSINDFCDAMMTFKLQTLIFDIVSINERHVPIIHSLFSKMDCSDLRTLKLDFCVKPPMPYMQTIYDLFETLFKHNNTLTELDILKFPSVCGGLRDMNDWQPLLETYHKKIKFNEVHCLQYYDSNLIHLQLRRAIMFEYFCNKNKIKLVQLDMDEAPRLCKKMVELIQQVFLTNKVNVPGIWDQVFKFVGGDIKII